MAGTSLVLSFWAYIDAGYTATDWNMLLGWMTGVSGKPSPISHVGLEVWEGKLQVVYLLKNCSVGPYPCPTSRGTRMRRTLRDDRQQPGRRR